MKFLLTTIILLGIFFITLQANAQKNYWEKAEAKYQSDYRQRIVDNMNMKPSTYKNPYASSGGDIDSYFKNKADAKATDLAAKKAAEKAEKEAEKAEKIKEAARVEEFYKKLPEFEKIDRERNENYERAVTPYRAKFAQAGFCKSEIERKNMLGLVAWTEKSGEIIPLIDIIIKSKNSFELKKNKATADELLFLISSYFPTWETALADLDFVETKFPQYKGKIDTARIYCYAYYFGMQYPGNDNLERTYFRYDAAWNKPEMVESFFKLVDKYPEIAARSVALTPEDRNPINIKLKSFIYGGSSQETYVKCKSEDAKKYGMLALMALPPFVENKQEQYWPDLLTFEKESKLMSKRLTPEDWVKISIAHNGSPMNVIKKIYFGNRELNVIPPNTDTRNNGNLFISEAYRNNPINMSNAMRIIEKIAALGDPEALNTLGVGIAMGLTYYTKGVEEIDCIGIFEEAAKQGSVWAQFNLVFAGGFELKRYKDKHRQKALNGFSDFIKTADTATLKKAVNIIYRMGGRAYIKAQNSIYWTWYKAMPPELIGDLLKTAAAKGITDAQYYLDKGYAW